jgi:hypothetical protein
MSTRSSSDLTHQVLFIVRNYWIAKHNPTITVTGSKFFGGRRSGSSRTKLFSTTGTREACVDKKVFFLVILFSGPSSRRYGRIDG